MAKYNEIMERLSVDDEMRERVLAAARQAPAASPRVRAFRPARYLVPAACFVLLLVGVIALPSIVPGPESGVDAVVSSAASENGQAGETPSHVVSGSVSGSSGAGAVSSSAASADAQTAAPAPAPAHDGSAAGERSDSASEGVAPNGLEGASAIQGGSGGAQGQTVPIQSDVVAQHPLDNDGEEAPDDAQADDLAPQDGVVEVREEVVVEETTDPAENAVEPQATTAEDETVKDGGSSEADSGRHSSGAGSVSSDEVEGFASPSDKELESISIKSIDDTDDVPARDSATKTELAESDANAAPASPEDDAEELPEQNAAIDVDAISDATELSSATGVTIADIPSVASKAQEITYCALGTGAAEVEYALSKRTMWYRATAGIAPADETAGFDDVSKEKVGSVTVLLAGDGDGIAVASWKVGSTTYSITVSDAVKKSTMLTYAEEAIGAL